MSKKKQQFLDNTLPYGFDEKMLAGTYDEMMRLRCNYIETQQVLAFEEGRVFYRLTLYRDQGSMPALHGFHAVLRYVPLIEHGVFAGIDTRKLEQRMEAVDWLRSTPDVTALYPKDVDTLVKIWKEMERLKQCGDNNASDIVAQLQVKYWMGTLAERYTHLDMRTSRYDHSHYFDSIELHQGITAHHAYHLLSGRPVFREVTQEHWFQLKRIIEPSTIKMFDEYRFPGFDLREKLNVLPLKELLIPGKEQQLVQDLKDGALPYGTLTDKETEIPVRLSVDPEKQSIKILDTSQTIAIIKAIDAHNKQRFSGNRIDPAIRSKPGKNKGRSL
jgi:hypothetical protein